jgi:Sulfotransferase family
MTARRALETRVREAANQRGFELYFQPLREADTGGVRGLRGASAAAGRHWWHDPALNLHSDRRGHPYAHDLSDLGWYYRQYEGLMAHWRTVVPDLLLDVRYEELVEDLEGQTRRILDFLGLPFDEACLDFQANRRSVATFSRVQVRQPLYRTSMERWRPYEKHLGPLIEALGEL